MGIGAFERAGCARNIQRSTRTVIQPRRAALREFLVFSWRREASVLGRDGEAFFGLLAGHEDAGLKSF